MSRKFPVNKYEWIEDNEDNQFNEDFIKNYNEESNNEYFLGVYVKYAEKLHELHNNLPFSSKKMKVEKVQMFITILHYKTEYVIHIRSVKQALNHGLILKTFHKVIKFDQNAWLKPFIDMNINEY